MKKLFVLAAFASFLAVGAQAQTPAPKAKATATKQEAAKVTPPNTNADAVPAEAPKKEEKKECSSDEKKACGSGKSTGKKSCCGTKKAS